MKSKVYVWYDFRADEIFITNYSDTTYVHPVARTLIKHFCTFLGEL